MPKRRYWVVGETGADLGANGSEDGYSKAQAVREAEEWSDVTEGRIEVVPVRASYRAGSHLRYLRHVRTTPSGIEVYEDAPTLTEMEGK